MNRAEPSPAAGTRLAHLGPSLGLAAQNYRAQTLPAFRDSTIR